MSSLRDQQAELRSLVDSSAELAAARRQSELRLDQLSITDAEDALSDAAETLEDARARHLLGEASEDEVSAASAAHDRAREDLASRTAAAGLLRQRMTSLDADRAVIDRRIDLLYRRLGRSLQIRQADRVQVAALGLGVELQLFAQLMSCAAGVGGGATSGHGIFQAWGGEATFRQAHLDGHVSPTRVRQLDPSELAALEIPDSWDRLHVVDGDTDPTDPPPAPPPAAA